MGLDSSSAGSYLFSSVNTSDLFCKEIRKHLVGANFNPRNIIWWTRYSDYFI